MSAPRTILITGASSGIGAALAIGYARYGVTLILIARNEERLAEIVKSCRARGAQTITTYIDVRDHDAMAAFITQVDAVTPIDLVIANAGISAGSFEGGETPSQAEEVFAVNLGGVLSTIHPLIEPMKKRRRGQIAIMSSLASICALPGAPSYSASKAAVRYYGEALSGALAPYNIVVSVICPGWIRTPLTDKNQFPMPFIMSAERAAALVIHRLSLKKTRIAFPRRLYFPLCILAVLPISWTQKLMMQLPEKRLKS